MRKAFGSVVLVVCLFLLAPAVAFSEGTYSAEMQDFVAKYLSAGSEYYKTDEMYAELRSFPPKENTELWRLIRKKEIEDYRAGLGEFGYSDEEYLKGKTIDEILTIAEDVALEWYGTPFSALGLEEEHAVMREAFSQYTGDVSALATDVLCALESYPQVYSYKASTGYIFAIALARKINTPGENPCDYELAYTQEKSYVYGTTSGARAMLTLPSPFGFGGKLNGRSELGARYLIVGEGRASLHFPFDTEWHLLTEVVMW